jgi:hypothetical protein
MLFKWSTQYMPFEQCRMVLELVLKRFANEIDGKILFRNIGKEYPVNLITRTLIWVRQYYKCHNQLWMYFVCSDVQGHLIANTILAIWKH